MQKFRIKMPEKSARKKYFLGLKKYVMSELKKKIKCLCLCIPNTQ